MNIHIFVCLVILARCIHESNSNFDLRTTDSKRNLSRKKRYLTFPEGSSLQLIFCWVVPIVGMPNIFTMGLTAAVAWELPTKPEELFKLKKKDDADNRRVSKPGEKLPAGGWALQGSHAKYHKMYSEAKTPPRIPSINYMKPTYHSTMWGSPAYRDGVRRKNWRKNWQTSQRRDNYDGNNRDAYYLSPIYQEVHRRTRRDFFQKIEKILMSKQLDGKTCLLKMICQINKTSAHGLGSFWEEILKTVFRIRSVHVGQPDQYDLAAYRENNCEEMYPTCSFD